MYSSILCVLPGSHLQQSEAQHISSMNFMQEL